MDLIRSLLNPCYAQLMIDYHDELDHTQPYGLVGFLLPPIESRLVSTLNREENMPEEHTTEDAIRLTRSVPASVERAYAVFAEEFASWYPTEYTWSQDVLDTIGIEAHQGGRCFERGPHGFWIDWGRVLVWEPPRRLAFSWQISPRREPVPDPTKASEIELHFHEEESLQSTRLEFEHRAFTRHGEGAEGYREALGSEQGWPYILDRYVAAFG